MTSSLAPNPCLVAIVLVIRTRAGPKVVYHYPLNPSDPHTSRKRHSAWQGASGTFTDPSTSSASDDSSDSDNAKPGEDSSSRAGSRSSAGRGSGRRDVGGSLRSGRTRETGTAFSNDDLDEEMPDRERHELHSRRGGNRSEHGLGFDHDSEPAWNHIFGFSTDALAKLLSPGRAFHKRRFEFGVDDLVFVGAPRFVRDDGSWKKKKRAKRHGHKKEDFGQDAQTKGSRTMGVSLSQLSKQFDEVPAYGAAYGHGSSAAPSEAHSESHSVSSGGQSTENDLIMFSVVFVMSPPALEYSVRVQEMYEHIVKKFAKALKYAQATTNYVYQESRAILLMKDKGKESHTAQNVLWSTIAQNSSLARAIMVTFNTISDDKITHINLGRDFDASFQLPQPVSISSVSTPVEPQMPGLWLTTATPWEHDDPDTLLSPHSALLLLEDDDVLLKEVESDAKELSGPLSYFVRNLTPEKSLLKIAQKSSLSINDVQLLARHLIYWRRGRAIPPLRQRDVYIVSPNADMRKLKTATTEFATRFPTLPSLASILNLLSGTPRPWFTLFPSRDHRGTYMRILAWLMRHGWVTQLRTFGWIRVSAEVKDVVASKIDSEMTESKISASSVEVGSSPIARATDSSSEHTNTTRRKQSRDVIASPHSSTRRRPDSVASDSTSVSSGQTAVTVVPQQHIPPFSPLSKPIGGNISGHASRTSVSTIDSSQDDSRDQRPSSATTTTDPTNLTSPALRAIPAYVNSPLQHPQQEAAPVAPQQTASIIHSPQKASALQLRWIDHIGSSFTSPISTDGATAQQRSGSQRAPIKSMEQEASELWPLLLKYFDGRHAFEEIYLREGLKKRRIAGVLSWLSGEGWLVTVRHW